MNSISESYESNPIPLDFKSLLNIPDSHEWALPTEHPIVDPLTFGSLPLIDLSDPNAPSLIRHACEKWGVIQVINHAVPLNLLKEVELQTPQLFSLPTHRKLSALRSPEGITGYGMLPISAFFPKLMWSEDFSMMGSPVEHATQLWPRQPGQQTSFCDIMEKYQKEMRTFCVRILDLMLESLSLTREDVQWLKPEVGCSNRYQSLLQLNSYPICSDPGRVMGLAPHTESSLLTVIHQSSCTAGLQVFGDGIGWVPVHPISGALVVNLGDLMHILSNGQFKNVMHRVFVNKTHHRFSVAYFFGPPKDVKISPVIRLTDNDHPSLYCAVTWKEYLEIKSKHFSKALALIRNKKAAKF